MKKSPPPKRGFPHRPQGDARTRRGARGAYFRWTSQELKKCKQLRRWQLPLPRPRGHGGGVRMQRAMLDAYPRSWYDKTSPERGRFIDLAGGCKGEGCTHVHRLNFSFRGFAK